MIRCADCGMSRADYLVELSFGGDLQIPCCEDPELPFWHPGQWRVDAAAAQKLAAEAAAPKGPALSR